MKKGLDIIIYILIILIIILLSWKTISVSKLNNNKLELMFNINSKDVEIKIGSSTYIDYEAKENINIKWESEDNSIVTVEDAIITGVGLGDTVIKGTVVKDDETIVKSCHVSTYYGDKSISLTDIIVDDGELFITKGDTYELSTTYSPDNSYITSIEYKVEDENVVDFDGKVIAKEIGATNITVIVNENISKSILVHVIEKEITPVFAKQVTGITIDTSSISLKPNEKKKIDYQVNPSDAFIENIKWESSDNNVLDITDGLLTAKNPGNATVKLTINNLFTEEIKVSVGIPVTGISLISNPQIVLKVGEKESIKTNITPGNATNKKVKYSSSTNNVSISDDGVVHAISAGSGTITIKTEDASFKTSVSYTVNKKTGVVNGTGGIWKYSTPLDKTPVRAGLDFFKNLASKGKGTISGNVYTYTDSSRTYKYDISFNKLNVNGSNVYFRIYYPQGVDLSEVNTFTFMGGSGELNFNGYFSYLDQNRSEMSSSGIIILVSAKGSYDPRDGLYATDFVRSIVGQKSGVKNAIGGYSASGPSAGDAAEQGIYDRLIIFCSSVGHIATSKNLKNKEITIYSPVRDALTDNTTATLNYMVQYGLSNVTLVSNNQQMVNKFESKFLVINPGDQMGMGHGYDNISKARIFSYACR